MIDEKFILQTLQNAVKDAVAASDEPTLPIAFVDVTFDKPNDGKYVEIVHMPNNPDGQYWGDERNARGVMRLILHWPKNGQGSYDPLDLLKSVGDHFTKELWLNGIQLTDTPKFTGSLATDTEILYPCSLRYQYFSQ